MATRDSNASNVVQIERTSLSDAHSHALWQHQQAIDQARAICELLRDRLRDGCDGNGDPIDPESTCSAVECVTGLLKTVKGLADSVALDRRGRELLAAQEAANA